WQTMSYSSSAGICGVTDFNKTYTKSYGYTFCPQEGIYDIRVKSNSQGSTYFSEGSDWVTGFYTVNWDTDANWCACKGGTFISAWTGGTSKCCGDDGASDNVCVAGGASCVNGVYSASHCNDGVQNCDETKTDCGGADCGLCASASVTAPNAAGYITGTYSIQFSAINGQSNETHAKLAYSANRLGFQNTIVADMHLENYSATPGLSCADTDFHDWTSCTYSWNTTAITDGNYYVDVNVWTSGGSDAQDSSDVSFFIDNNPPFTSNNAPSGWQTTDVNVNLKCTDSPGSGCLETTWRIDQDFWQKKSGSIASLWWNSSWLYRNLISFNNSGKAAQANYSALIRLDINNFNFSLAKSNGADLRFVKSDNNTLLDYFFDRYDSTAKIATIWVKIPTLLADSNSTYIYMYYGNAAASDAQASNWFP
ncbi:MAG: DUF2341 domain-containing protein, partial [Candidatus Diapherotrites archaeon]